MVFGNIAHVDEFSFLEDSVKECFAYFRNHELKDYQKGNHGIDGDRLYVNILEYMTMSPKERFWEAHKKYLDIHIMISGEEQIDLNFIDNMRLKEYVPAEDFQPMDGEKNGSIILRPGDFLVCYPRDGHRTAVSIGKPKTVKKAIFKAQI